MKKLVDGQKIAAAIIAKTAQKVKSLARRGVVPKLAVVLVGSDNASQVYVGKKQTLAKELGINFSLHTFPDNISKTELVHELKVIQTDPTLSGVIIQLPLPERLYDRNIINVIKPEFDIDFLTDTSLGSLMTKNNQIEPPTASAMVEVLRSLKINLVGKRVAVIGAGVLVGRPLSILLLNESATVTVCHSATKNLKEICLASDIVISAVGKANLIRGNMLKKGAVVIDAGFSFIKGHVAGDVNVIEALKIARFVTPTPGGVGPVTVAKLLYNVACAAEMAHAKK